MAAGLGFKTFTTGEVLTAADTNGYLMQGVLVFASATARDTAITSPQEGQFAYLKDTNVTTYYTGSAWANLDTTGMTNPMTTTGDTIYSSSGSTPARLGIGTTGQVLTVSGGLPAWSTISGGGYTSIASGSLSGTSVNITSIPSGYIDLVLYIENRTHNTTGGSAAIRINNDSSTIYRNCLIYGNDSGIAADQTIIRSGGDAPTSGSQSMEMIRFYQYADSGIQKVMDINAFTTGASIRNNLALYCTTTAITQINIVAEGGRTLTGGTYILYGVK